MANVLATDVTVTVNERWIEGRKRYADVTLAFGNGAATYGTGIPMPAYTSFGMRRNLDSLRIYFANYAGYVWEFERSGNGILHALVTKGFTPSGNFTGNAANHAHNFVVANNGTISANLGMNANGLFVTDEATAITVAGNQAGGISNANIAPAGVIAMNAVANTAMIELANVAVAAQSLRGIAVGW